MLNKLKEKMKKRKQKKKGFTLVELLAVIVILAVIMVVTIPTVLGSMNKAKQSAFNTVGETMIKYLEDNYKNCMLGNGNIAKFDDSIFNPDCSLKTDDLEKLSKNLIINSGYKLEDIEKVAVSDLGEGKFGVIVSPADAGEFNNLNTYVEGTYKNECWKIEPINKNEYKLAEFYGVNIDEHGNEEYNGKCPEYLSENGDVTIPGEIDGIETKIIGDNLFYLVDINSVTIPASVEVIGDSAFHLSTVRAVTIEGAEDGTSKLKKIGKGAFGDAYITSIKLPKSIKIIDDSAFSCSGLSSVVIPKSVEKIGDFAFSCLGPQMNSLIIEGAEDGTSRLKTIGKRAFWLSTFTSLTIPSSVESIGDEAFRGNMLNSLVFDGTEDGTSKLKTIGNKAFDNSEKSESYKSSIKDLIIPSSIETIGDYAFAMNYIESLKFVGSNNGTSRLKTIGEGSFALNPLKSLIVPKNVETIKDYAFFSNMLNSLVFEGTKDGTSKLKTIGVSAFDNSMKEDDAENIYYSKISNLVIPKSVETIGEFAFVYNNIESVEFKVDEDGTSSLKRIGDGAFAVNNLTYPIGTPLIIPKTVETIGEETFVENPNLKQIQLLGNPTLGTFWNGEASIIK